MDELGSSGAKTNRSENSFYTQT